ncbi:hypothetical protein BDY21DRAFT_26138 [Lineolata rhizophorae]|uniref:Uncharacterized protein n=1 Tax=Lineolata rhizophorae TaxID=578093 RepID=A0A6A6P0C7_9PEZI|nr:hypothetical protein BDY21DRAFT_26138 [Lineolata rhizophorae]
MTQASYPAGAPTTAPYPLPHGGHASAVVAPSAQQHHYEEDRLYEVNQQIKTVLTGLLNCEAVRHGDSGFRAWVQGRLMDNELELKRQRRRRSSVDNREVADFIATHLDHHGFRYTV